MVPRKARSRFLGLVLLAALSLTPEMRGEDLGPDAAQGSWASRLRFGVWTLAGDDPTLASMDDLEPLRRLIGDATVVGLGESYHTSAGFYRMKHRVFRFLVEEMGFRAFAIESLWQGAESTARYVRTCEGTPEAAIRDHINVWQSSEYADLVRWMCEWNRTHPGPADQLSFFGFDIQQPWYDGPELLGFLERIGVPRSDPRAAGINSCEAVVDRFPFGQIPQARHDACLQALTSIEEHFVANRAEIVRSTSERELTIAMLRVIGLRAWERSVFVIAHDFAAGYNARDEGMAYAFHVQRELKAPNAKTVVWAANTHVAQTVLPRGEQPFGSHLAEALGDDYVSFALTAHDTEIDFPGLGCGLVARTPGSVEDRLATRGAKALLVDTRSAMLRREIYTMGIDQVRPYRDYDGIIQLDRSPKMHPLVWASCTP